MNLLGVNIDHVATVRQARGGADPDPVWAAVEAELGGADGITFHLREDRRHIQDRDAELLRRTVRAKLNMEMAIDPAIVKIALALKPDQCTLVPERREELTTEGGLDVAGLRKRITGVVEQLSAAGILVSAFIEPEPEQVHAALECGCDAVELWTGGFANSTDSAAQMEAMERLADAAVLCHEQELVVHAGHGLNYRNTMLLATLGLFAEFNIGHSIVSRAVLVGMRAAVREMKDLLSNARLETLSAAAMRQNLGENEQ